MDPTQINSKEITSGHSSTNVFHASSAHLQPSEPVGQKQSSATSSQMSVSTPLLDLSQPSTSSAHSQPSEHMRSQQVESVSASPFDTIFNIIAQSFRQTHFLTEQYSYQPGTFIAHSQPSDHIHHQQSSSTSSQSSALNSIEHILSLTSTSSAHLQPSDLVRRQRTGSASTSQTDTIFNRLSAVSTTNVNANEEAEQIEVIAQPPQRHTYELERVFEDEASCTDFINAENVWTRVRSIQMNSGVKTIYRYGQITWKTM